MDPPLRIKVLDVSRFFALSLHDADVHKTSPFSLSYTILVNSLFTDGCFNLSMPPGTNDLGTQRPEL